MSETGTGQQVAQLHDKYKYDYDDDELDALQYYPSGRRYMGRLKQRWKQEQLQYQEEHVLVDLNPNVHYGHDNDNVSIILDSHVSVNH
jgi:hypothetical protein